MGCLPSIRLGDNLASLAGGVIGLVIGLAIIAPVLHGIMPDAPLGIRLLIGGVFLVGIVLMIVGLFRR